jgi:hypothetical protein
MTSITTYDRAVNQRVANPRRNERSEQNADSLRIIHALNGSEYSGMCRCPVHEDNRPSLHVSASGDGKVLVKCFARCSQDAVIAALKLRRLWPESRNQQRPRHSEPRPTTEPPDNSQRQDNEKERIAFARKILRVAGDNDDLTLAKRYFKSRGLTTIPPGALMLTAKQSSALLRRHFPAVVLPIVNRDPNQFKLAAHVIHLSKDGREKLAVPKPKKSYGVMKGGYVVVNPLDHLNPRLIRRRRGGEYHRRQPDCRRRLVCDCGGVGHQPA